MLSKHSVMIAAAVTLAGCRGGDHPATYPVSGSVHFTDRTPMKGATVKFRTSDRTPSFTASGKTDDQGRFQLNAAEGENWAIVVPTYPRDTDTMTQEQRYRVMNPIDPMFLDYEKSKLKFQVGTDPTKNQFEIKVWPPRR